MKTEIASVLIYEQFHKIRAITEGDEVWFVAKDVFDTLDLPWRGNPGLQAIPADWKGVRTFRTPQNNQHSAQGHRPQELIVLNFKAVCKVAFRSNKPEADRFTNWAAEVIYTVSRTGTYSLPVSPPSSYQGGEVLNANDMANLRRMVWIACAGLHAKNNWIRAYWLCMRKAVGIKAGDKFLVDHLPVLADELRRMCAVSDAVSTMVEMLNDKARALVLEGRDKEVIFKALNLQSGQRKELSLDSWTEKEIARLVNRADAIMDHPEMRELDVA